jgi:glycine/D-amino acid oxidase-like deaminating enzyme
MSRHDIIVIGGGIAGAALTYELARRGVRPLLIEARAIAGGASGATMGMALWVGFQTDDELATARAGIGRLAELADELDADADLQHRRLPALVLAPDSQTLDALHKQAARFNAAGLTAQIAEADQLAAIEPALNPAPFAGALVAEQDHLDTVALAEAYIRAARRLGATVREHIAISGFELTHGRVTAVRAGHESFAADQVVLAAGAWTRRLAALAGVDAPIYHIHGEAIATAPRPPTLRSMLMLASREGHAALEDRVAEAINAGASWEQWRDDRDARDLSAVQTRDGRVLLGQVSRADPAVSLPFRPAVIAQIHAVAARAIPALADAMIAHGWIAPVPFTADHQPLIGRAPTCEMLYIFAGFRSAVITAPVAASLLAQQLLAGTVAPAWPDR